MKDWRNCWQPTTRGGFEVVDVRPPDKDGDMRVCWWDGYEYGNAWVGSAGRYRSGGADDEHDLLPVEQPATTPGQAAYEAFIAGCGWDGVAAAAVRAVGTAFAVEAQGEQAATRNDVGVDLNAKLHYLGAVTWTHQQLDEIGKQAVNTIASLTAERDRLRAAAINARAELQNHDRYQLIDGLRLEWEQKWVEWDEADTTLGTYTAADGYWCFEPMHSTKQVSGKCNSRTESRELCLADYKQRVRAIFEGQPQRKDG